MDTPIGQFVLIGNFRRRLARELLVLLYNIFIAFGCTSLVVIVVVIMVVDVTQCNVTRRQVGERLGVNEMRGPSGVNEMR